MGTSFIVLTADRGDPKHGEITVLDSVDKVERLVETLLEAGYDHESIQVLAGERVDFQIKQRPVVTLAAEGSHDSAAEPPPEQDEDEDEGEEAVPQSEAAEDDAEDDTVEDEVAEDAEAEEPRTARERISPLFGRLRARSADPLPELHH